MSGPKVKHLTLLVADNACLTSDYYTFAINTKENLCASLL